MDFDIALPGGVPKEYLDRYDPSFLEDIFSADNIVASSRPNHFQNICTVIDEKTVKEILKRCDLVGLGLILMNEVFFKEPADGMVSLSAQQAIEPHIANERSSGSLIISSPHAVLDHPFANELLERVETVIQEKPYVIRPR